MGVGDVDNTSDCGVLTVRVAVGFNNQTMGSRWGLQAESQYFLGLSKMMCQGLHQLRCAGLMG